MTDLESLKALLAEGKGDRAIARILSEQTGEHVTRNWVRTNALKLAGSAQAPAIISANGGLSPYESARQALAVAKTLDDVKSIHDITAAMEAYARRAKDRTLMLDAIELRMRAERRYGEMLGSIKATVGLSKGGRPAEKHVPTMEQVLSAPTLEEIGTDRKFSSRTQKVAAIPEAEFETKLATWRERHIADNAKDISHDVLKPDPQARREERQTEMRKLSENPLLLPQGPFAAGVADPPWEDPDAPIGQTGRHYRDHYCTMTPAEIAAFTDGAGRKIADIFAPDAFLALWVTRHILAIGAHLPVLRSWGFWPKTVITWDKQIAGLGNGYVRDVTEHLVLATRGNPAAPEPELRPPSLFSSRKTSRHSEKPDWPQEWIERWFKQMSYVELFARAREPGEGARPGWCCWGNESPKQEAAE